MVISPSGFGSHKQIVAQGKKPVPISKPTWIPITNNPSDIGSSLAFSRPQQDVPTSTKEVQRLPQPIITAEVHRLPPPQPPPQTQVPTQHDITADKEQHTSLVENINVERHDIVTSEEENSDAQFNVDIDADIPIDDTLEQNTDSPSLAATVTSNLSQNSFSMPLENVRDEFVHTEIAHNVPILTPVQILDVSSIAAGPDATIDPTLQKEMNFMKTWLEKAAETKVPFSPVLSNSQEKKLNKLKESYQTRSQGPLPTSQ